MVKEIIPGGGESQFSYAALFRDGLSLASIVARRTRQYPIDFGQFSTFVETVEEPRVVAPSERLMAAMRFTGLAEIEFKQDPPNGEFKLLATNPRLWAWPPLCAPLGG